ncbi:endonuclease III [Sediminispirochaeta bajacaliforniensis]|uniref:endonuclease III n=1 Tax=Sediminispirochaeta bajacaliforniensis TaxID=148 RepID=UPI000375468A|nr:endonuclease III [Sediminispirochaeta bajacaliforniensis]
MNRDSLSAMVVERLLQTWPKAETLLRHDNCYQLMIAVILSSRTTDAQVNVVTEKLFRRFPDAKSLAEADGEEIEDLIHSVGFYRVKARHIVAAAAALLEKFDGRVPESMEELLMIPGLGRKGANVVLGECFGKPAIIVDTHFGRVVRRIGLSDSENPAIVERELKSLIPSADQTDFSMAANLHGRYVCLSRNPRCSECVVQDVCRYFSYRNRSSDDR